MEIHCQVKAFMHTKFQPNRPSNYGVIVIVRKLTPLHLNLHVARALGVIHIYRSNICVQFLVQFLVLSIVQFLVEGMKLPYKKRVKDRE